MGSSVCFNSCIIFFLQPCMITYFPAPGQKNRYLSNLKIKIPWTWNQLIYSFKSSVENFDLCDFTDVTTIHVRKYWIFKKNSTSSFLNICVHLYVCLGIFAVLDYSMVISYGKVKLSVFDRKTTIHVIFNNNVYCCLCINFHFFRFQVSSIFLIVMKKWWVSKSIVSSWYYRKKGFLKVFDECVSKVTVKVFVKIFSMKFFLKLDQLKTEKKRINSL